MGRIGHVLCADWFGYTTFSSSPRVFHFCLVCRAIEHRSCGRVLAQGRAASLAVGQRLSPPAAARPAPRLAWTVIYCDCAIWSHSPLARRNALGLPVDIDGCSLGSPARTTGPHSRNFVVLPRPAGLCLIDPSTQYG